MKKRTGLTLTPENIKHAKVCIDRDPLTKRTLTWLRTPNGRWREKDHEDDDTISDQTMLDYVKTYDTRVVEFLPGRGPKVPKKREKAKKAKKWALGYVTAKGDVPPRGTVLHNGECVYRANIDDAVLQQAGWVVVKVAQQVAPKPERVWRKVMLEASGDGDDAQIRFPDGGVFDNRDPVYPSTIIAHAPPVPPRPSREEVADAVRRWARKHITEDEFLDICCGKDGE